MKTLVVGPGYHGYNESITRAFHELGMEAESLPFEEGKLLQRYAADMLSPRVRVRGNLADRFLGKSKSIARRTVLRDGTLSPSVPTLRRFGEVIRKKMATECFDLLLVIKGTVILPEALLKIRRSRPEASIVLWQQDSMVRYPLVLKAAKYYDEVYVTEPMDIPSLRRIGVEGSVLPSCYDPAIYRPLHASGRHEFKRDVAFVGEGRPERFVFFKSLAKDISSTRKETSIGIFGARWEPFRKDSMNSGIPGIRWDINPTDLTPTEVNKIYNESRICLNIHHAQALTGLNLRTFEIPGSRSLEIVDRKSTLNEHFEEDRELIAFGPGDRLHEKITALLDDNELISTIASRGHDRAIRDHTYVCRIRRLLSRL